MTAPTRDTPEAFRQGAEVLQTLGFEGVHDTYQTDLPTCPFCGCEDEDWWDDKGLDNNEDTRHQECGSCERAYTVTMHLEPTFTTQRRVDTIAGDIAWRDSQARSDAVIAGQSKRPVDRKYWEGRAKVNRAMAAELRIEQAKLQAAEGSP